MCGVRPRGTLRQSQFTNGVGQVAISERELIAAARQARRHARAAFSSFKVGAALETRDGAIVTGIECKHKH